MFVKSVGTTIQILLVFLNCGFVISYYRKCIFTITCYDTRKFRKPIGNLYVPDITRPPKLSCTADVGIE